MSVQIRAGANVSLDIAAVVDRILDSGAAILGETYAVDHAVRKEARRLTRHAPLPHRHLAHRRVLLITSDTSGLAARAIASATGSPRLRVMDSVHPSDIRMVIGQLTDSVVVITSHSGDSSEAETILRVVTAAYRTLGDHIADRVVVITRPGTSLDTAAEHAGATRVACTAHRGGNLLAMSALTLVPCLMAGIDVDRILASAGTVAAGALSDRAENVALLLAAAFNTASHQALGVVPTDASWFPLAKWAAMVVRSTSGKRNVGILAAPLRQTAPELGTRHPDVLVAHVGLIDGTSAPVTDGIELIGDLGEILTVWQYAAAVAAHVLGVEPTSAPEPEITNARVYAMSKRPEGSPRSEPPGAPAAASENLPDVTGLTPQQAISVLLNFLPPDGHLTISNHAGSTAEADLTVLQGRLAALTGRPVLLNSGTAELAAAAQFDRAGSDQGAHLLLWAPAAGPFAPDTLSLTLLSHARFLDDVRTLTVLGRPIIILTAALSAELTATLLQAPTPTP